MKQQLYDCCKKGVLNEVKRLIALSTDYNEEAIYWASENGHLDIVQYLVSLCTNFDNINFAICCASANGHLNIVQYLASLGADIHMFDDYAVRWASSRGHLNIVQFLVERGADFRADNNSAIRRAFQNGHLNIVIYLASLGAHHQDVIINFDLINGLYSSGHFDVIHKLISHNNINISNIKIEQFNLIKKSVEKIVKKRKWNDTLFCTLTFTDVSIKFR